MRNETSIEILAFMRSKLAMGWIQGFLAIDEQGAPVSESSEYAVAWCPVGALASKSSPGLSRSLLDEVYRLLLQSAYQIYPEIRASGEASITRLNDRYVTSQGEALLWMDTAILIAEEEKNG